VESSAFNALNINLVFEAIVRKILRERKKKERGEMGTENQLAGRPEVGVKLLHQSGNIKKGCC
jgi:GTPase SAR1 family protein